VKDKILIITGEEDPMWSFLLDACREEEKEKLVHYVTDRPWHSQCSYDPINRTVRFLIENNYFVQDEIKGVWWRRIPTPEFKNFTPEMRRYCEEEYAMFLQGLEYVLPQAIWVSKPLAINQARNKALQLSLAKEIGFSLLETVFTNSPIFGKEFIDGRKSIYKSIKSPRVPLRPDKHTTVFTSVLDNSQQMDGLISCPGILQQFVEKLADIRISVFGKKVFAVRIESQQNDASKIDFRMGARYVDHLIHELPEDVSDKCKKLVDKLGLLYGAIDLALLEDGSYVFFEINPNGQWGWLEEKTGLPMRRALLDILFGYGS